LCIYIGVTPKVDCLSRGQMTSDTPSAASRHASFDLQVSRETSFLCFSHSSSRLPLSGSGPPWSLVVRYSFLEASRVAARLPRRFYETAPPDSHFNKRLKSSFQTPSMPPLGRVLNVSTSAHVRRTRYCDLGRYFGSECHPAELIFIFAGECWV
jgi:hypothetical protein